MSTDLRGRIGRVLSHNLMFKTLAFIFAILTLIFAVLAVTSHGDHEESTEGAHG